MRILFFVKLPWKFVLVAEKLLIFSLSLHINTVQNFSNPNLSLTCAIHLFGG